MPTITSESPSRILDEHHDDRPACVYQPIRAGILLDTCGKPATHEVIRTCCGGPMSYLCSEHVTAHHDVPCYCAHCEHWCEPGVCLHRIIIPL